MNISIFGLISNISHKIHDYEIPHIMAKSDMLIDATSTVLQPWTLDHLQKFTPPASFTANGPIKV